MIKVEIGFNYRGKNSGDKDFVEVAGKAKDLLQELIFVNDQVISSIARQSAQSAKEKGNCDGLPKEEMLDYVVEGLRGWWQFTEDISEHELTEADCVEVSMALDKVTEILKKAKEEAMANKKTMGE